MNQNIMQENKVGTGVLAYGYEAVARGALEADVRVVAGFPGTPSSGALQALASVSQENNFHVEWSTNEKVAMEVTWGAAMNGQRALCTVNHLGANVIVDALRFAVNYGVRGGLVLFVGDDIGANTSAIEADTRFTGSAADMPILEPSTRQEALEMARYAFKLSEELGTPVMLRSVNQVMMSRGLVTVGEIERDERPSEFVTSPRRFSLMKPGVIGAVAVHRFLHLNLLEAQKILLNQEYDQFYQQEQASVGLIGCGVCYSLAKEALDRMGLSDQVSLLKLGVLNPLNQELITNFINSVDTVLVLEEGEAYVEQNVQAIAGRLGISKQILGRLTKTIPIGGELLIPDIIRGIENAFTVSGQSIPNPIEIPIALSPLEERTMTLCAGCPHMGTFYGLRKAVEEVSGGKYVAVSDAGCAFMGILSPARTLDSATNMGGAIGLASGAALSGSEVPVIAVVGDGGMLHGGLPALINAVYNKAPIVVLLLDNHTLANTGLQPTANSGQNATGKKAPSVDLAGICREAGVPFITTVNPLHADKTKKAITQALQAPKPAVVVLEEPCMLLRLKEEKAENLAPKKVEVVPELCTSCGDCMKLFCPAIYWEGPHSPENNTLPVILTDICTGCDLCVEVCTYDAIIAKEAIA